MFYVPLHGYGRCVGGGGGAGAKVTVTVGHAAGVNRGCVDISHCQHVTINYNCIWSQKVAQRITHLRFQDKFLPLISRRHLKSLNRYNP